MKLQDKRNGRMQRALQRLEAQLVEGTKPAKSGKGTTVNEFVGFKMQEPLTPTDIVRIKKEVSILKSKIILS